MKKKPFFLLKISKIPKVPSSASQQQNPQLPTSGPLKSGGDFSFFQLTAGFVCPCVAGPKAKPRKEFTEDVWRLRLSVDGLVNSGRWGQLSSAVSSQLSSAVVSCQLTSAVVLVFILILVVLVIAVSFRLCWKLQCNSLNY